MREQAKVPGKVPNKEGKERVISEVLIFYKPSYTGLYILLCVTKAIISSEGNNGRIINKMIRKLIPNEVEMSHVILVHKKEMKRSSHFLRSRTEKFFVLSNQNK